MKIKDIADREEANTDLIHLYRDGLFLVAYEHSAFQWARWVNSYNVRRKFYKSLDRELARLGFPEKELDRNIARSEVELIERVDDRITLRSPHTLDRFGFENWKRSLEIHLPKVKRPPVVSCDNEVFRLLEVFKHRRSTPLDCYFLVKDLQRHLDYILQK
jgi:hypothetical protein